VVLSGKKSLSFLSMHFFGPMLLSASSRRRYVVKFDTACAAIPKSHIQTALARYEYLILEMDRLMQYLQEFEMEYSKKTWLV
jgi:hypothetical protein